MDRCTCYREYRDLNRDIPTEQTRTLRTSLWKQPDFLRLWSSETISSFGAQFTELAIPLTAVLILRANSFQLGFLNAALTSPFLFFSLFAGVWADRHRRRRVMIASNIARALLLAIIPLSFVTGALSLYLLLAVAVSLGVFRVLFDIAYQAFLTSLVDKEDLVEANGRMEASRAVASVAGPGVAGLVIQIVTAPLAILLDITSFFSSTMILARIRRQEEPTQFQTNDLDVQPSFLGQMKEGLRVVANDPRLRSLAGAAATANFLEFAIQAIFILYAVDVLLLSPELLGIILSVGATGAIVGALLAGWLSRRIGIGPSLILSLVLGVVVWGPLIYLATPSTSIVLLVVAWFFGELSFVSYSINSSSFRQAICPAHLQGRVSATLRFLSAGMVPLGSIAGGMLGGFLGLHVAIGLLAVVLLTAPVWLILSPMRRIISLSETLTTE